MTTTYFIIGLACGLIWMFPAYMLGKIHTLKRVLKDLESANKEMEKFLRE